MSDLGGDLFCAGLAGGTAAALTYGVETYVFQSAAGNQRYGMSGPAADALQIGVGTAIGQLGIGLLVRNGAKIGLPTDFLDVGSTILCPVSAAGGNFLSSKFPWGEDNGLVSTLGKGAIFGGLGGVIARTYLEGTGGGGGDPDP